MSVTSSLTTRTTARHRVSGSTRGGRRRVLVFVVAIVALAAVAVPLELSREALTTALFGLANRFVGDSPIGMAVAGWVTYGLLPLAAIVLDRDHRRRYGQDDVQPLSDSTQLIQRIKASSGHHVARRRLTYWWSRTPLLALIVLAAYFLPVPGAGHSDLVDTMSATRSGAAFLIGWQWACVAAVVGVLMVVMSPVVAAIRAHRPPSRFPTRGYAAAALLSLAALIVAILSA